MKPKKLNRYLSTTQLALIEKSCRNRILFAKTFIQARRLLGDGYVIYAFKIL